MEGGGQAAQAAQQAQQAQQQQQQQQAPGETPAETPAPGEEALHGQPSEQAQQAEGACQQSTQDVQDAQDAATQPGKGGRKVREVVVPPPSCARARRLRRRPVATACHGGRSVASIRHTRELIRSASPGTRAPCLLPASLSHLTASLPHVTQKLKEPYTDIEDVLIVRWVSARIGEQDIVSGRNMATSMHLWHEVRVFVRMVRRDSRRPEWPTDT